MNSKEFEQDQRQFNRIMKRWSFNASKTLFGVFVLFFGGYLAFTMFPNNLFLFTLGCSIAAAFFALNMFRYWRQEQKMLRSLTPEELALIERVANAKSHSSREVASSASRLLQAHQSAMVRADKELLRASAPSTGDTLLRASIASDDTPKEELLRASEETKISL